MSTRMKVIKTKIADTIIWHKENNDEFTIMMIATVYLMILFCLCITFKSWVIALLIGSVGIILSPLCVLFLTSAIIRFSEFVERAIKSLSKNFKKWVEKNKTK